MTSAGKAILRAFACSFFLLTATACAHRPPASDPAALAAYQQADDPLEPMNRATFKFNMAFDRYLMRPLAVGYRTVVPKFLRNGITNFLNNITTPFILLNDVLQGQPDRAGVTVMRFVTNTTVGIGGLFDPATKWGWERHPADLGQTFGRWGMGEGVYLVLPFIGPSNPRDAIGLAGQFFGDPTSLYIKHEYGKKWSYARTGMDILDFRTSTIDTLDNLKANSADFYAAMRSAYRQNREYRINYGKPPVAPAQNDPFATQMDDDLDSPDATTKPATPQKPVETEMPATPDQPAATAKPATPEKPTTPEPPQKPEN